MSDAHARYEQLAVGHVLGGLDAVDAAEFRSHLIGCRNCRLRVAELRGIASELEAAEREERVAARVKTEVARRQEHVDEERDSRGPLSRRTIGILGVATALVATVLLVWNFHLRDVNAALLKATEAREQVLSMLASGEPADALFHEGVHGLVALEDGQVALDLAGLPEIGNDQWFGMWLVDGEPPHRFEFFTSGAVQDGRFAVHLPYYGAERLVVSIEDRVTGESGPPEEPGGRVLLEVELP